MIIHLHRYFIFFFNYNIVTIFTLNSFFIYDCLLRKIINKCLKSKFYYRGREWPYKHLKPRIIAEKYLTNYSRNFRDCKNDNKRNQQELTDYKFYCFNGYVDCVMVCYDRESGDTKFYFFDKQWELKRINKRGMEAPESFSLPKPSCLDEMFDIAARLSKGIPFVRVDLYQSDDHIYFGEMTFFPESGFDKNYLPSTDLYFGNLIDLSLAYSSRGARESEDHRISYKYKGK